jgi:hypothetical protein
MRPIFLNLFMKKFTRDRVVPIISAPEPIVAKISQEMLAEMIGTTRSRVSHFMNKFRKAGFISYNGHIEVHSSLLSVVLNDPAARSANSLV